MKKIDLDKESAIKALKNNQYSLLKNFKPELTADKEVIKAAFYKHFYEITEIKEDNDDKEPNMMGYEYAKFIHASVLNDLDFMVQLLQKCSGYMFSYLPVKFRSNKKLFKIAIQNTGSQYFTKTRKKMGLGVKHGLNGNLGLVKSSGRNILNDKDLMLLAMKHEPSSYYFLPDNLKEDKDIRCAMIETDSYGGFVLMKNNSVDTIKELKSFIKGHNKWIWGDTRTLEEMLKEVWDEKVEPSKKSDPEFIAFKKEYGL